MVRLTALITKLPPYEAPLELFEFEVVVTELGTVVVTTEVAIVVVALEIVVTPVSVERTVVVISAGMPVVDDSTPVVGIPAAVDVVTIVEVSVVVWVAFSGTFPALIGRTVIPRLIPMPRAIAIAENAKMRLLYSDKGC